MLIKIMYFMIPIQPRLALYPEFGPRESSQITPPAMQLVLGGRGIDVATQRAGREFTPRPLPSNSAANARVKGKQWHGHCFPQFDTMNYRLGIASIVLFGPVAAGPLYAETPAPNVCYYAVSDGSESVRIEAVNIASNQVIEIAWSNSTSGGTSEVLRTYWLDGFWTPHFVTTNLTVGAEISSVEAVMDLEPPTYNVCSHNLYRWQQAKTQWALDNGKNDQDVASFPNLIPYMGGTITKDDVCPSLGIYSLTTVGTKPTCDFQSEAFPHAVPE